MTARVARPARPAPRGAHLPPYTRPQPPAELAFPGHRFVRAGEVERLITEDFVAEGGVFHDPEHGRLALATIGVLWTNSQQTTKGRQLLGTLEIPKEKAKTWGEARGLALLHALFPEGLPDFIVTLYAPWWRTATDREVFALVDHELCHAAQAEDDFGQPRFDRSSGLPIWCTRGHDVEEFVGTVRRWGADATRTRELVAAGLERPTFDWVPGVDLGKFRCGACPRKAA